MIILSLDQALRVSGYAVFKENKLIKYGTFKTNPDIPVEQRLGQIWQELNNLHNEFNFELLAFEDIQQQQSPLTFKRLAYVQAAILLWAYFANVKCEVYPPTHWRKIVGKSWGKKREEQKQHAIELVKTYYDIDVSSDEADAILIGRAALCSKESNESAF